MTDDYTENSKKEIAEAIKRDEEGIAFIERGGHHIGATGSAHMKDETAKILNSHRRSKEQHEALLKMLEKGD